LQLPDGKTVQAVGMISSLEGITSLSIDIKPGASSNEKPNSIPVNIILSFDPIFPVLIPVEFVKDYDTFRRWPTCSQYPLAVVTVIPVEIKVRLLFQKGFCKSRFSHLTRPGNKDHLFFKIIADRFSQISSDYHVKYFAIKQKKMQTFLLLGKSFACAMQDVVNL
jgi:hypothetical protein